PRPRRGSAARGFQRALTRGTAAGGAGGDAMNPEVQSYLEHYQTTQGYLKLPTGYCEFLGGIRWSSEDDTLVYPDGKVFAFHAAIAEFLEGFSGGGRVIPFACVLHWAHMLQNGRRHPVAEIRT